MFAFCVLRQCMRQKEKVASNYQEIYGLWLFKPHLNATIFQSSPELEYEKFSNFNMVLVFSIHLSILHVNLF